MATYDEIANLPGDPSFQALVNKIAVAVAVKAQAIAASATPTANQITWAKSALESPRGQADQIVNYVIAANISATTTQILGAVDATIQTNVNDAVDKLLSA